MSWCSLLTATQSGVLQDMWHAGVIRRVGLEADGEDIIAVITGNVKMFGTSLVVLQVQGRQLKLGHMLGAQQGEAVKLLACSGIVRKLRHDSLRPVDSGMAQSSCPLHLAGGS